MGVAMAQVYSLKKGLKEFSQDGKNAVQSELQQNHNMDTYFPINSKELTRQQKRKALESLVNLVKEQYDQIKAQCGAAGSK